MLKFGTPLVLILLLVLACQVDRHPVTEHTDVNAGFIGRDSCRTCHPKQAELYSGSDHDLAMQPVSEKTVLGDFNDASLTHLGITHRFFISDDQFFVETENARGDMQAFQIEYTFGHYPLQQYLVKFSNGALQCLPLCWDSRPAAQGGQQWFHIYQDERIEPDDILFWTHNTQNWNHTCAECHSTNLQKQYDDATKTYHSTWAEIDVSCEACHGAGEQHVRWAEAEKNGQQIQVEGYLGLSIRLTEKEQASWIFKDMQKGTAERSVPLQHDILVDMCARCHARRSCLTENYQHGESLLNTHHPALLEESLYFADGQIQDEVYVYASFTQSKMHHAGVTCKDCHEPHSGKVYVQGNALCYRCHVPQKFGVTAHHFHDENREGASCFDCHMPERTYMAVDPRRDHSIRIPRPDLSDKLNTPNACVKCHDDKDNKWAAVWMDKWYGELEEGKKHYGEIFHDARLAWPAAEVDLCAIARDANEPIMRRTSALHYLGNYPSAKSFAVLQKALKEFDPLLRSAAAASMQMLSPEERWNTLKPMLRDSVRLVRHNAVQQLFAVASTLQGADKTLLDAVTQEYLDSQRINLDTVEGNLNYANYYVQTGDIDQAKVFFKSAIEIEPDYPFSYINLADLYRRQHDEENAERLLQQALQRYPDLAPVHHALGLRYVRQQQLSRALPELKAAAELAPDVTHFSYVYGLALHSTGNTIEACAVFTKTLNRYPADREILYALATIYRDQHNWPQALQYTEKLITFYPDDAFYHQLYKSLLTLEKENEL